jgi:hypothetical protein
MVPTFSIESEKPPGPGVLLSWLKKSSNVPALTLKKKITVI